MKLFNSSKPLAALFLCTTLALVTWTALNIHVISSHLDNNVFSLLPKSERNILAEEFIDRVAKNGERSLVVLLSSNNLETSLEAEKTFKSLIKSLDIKSTPPRDGYSEYLSKLLAHKSGLVTQEDVSQLASQSAAFWVDKSYAMAYSMSSSVIPWKDDPFGLLGDWLYKLGGVTKIRPYGDSLVVEKAGVSYVVLPMEANASVDSLSTQVALADAINVAIREVKLKHQGVEILKTGVIFFASDTSKSIQSDISLIGLISGISALLLVLFIFRSLYAVGVVLLTVSIGFLYAVLVCFFIFPKIYILTLAFGTSLIGMSVDYCLYWLTASIDDVKNPLERRRYLLPGMFLALITTAMGYFLMAITPFPVLSQMAVFSIAGISAAWLTVVLIFPHINKLRFSANSSLSLIKYIQSKNYQHSVLTQRVLIATMILVSAYGLLSFRANDNIRSLASFDKELVSQQIKASEILDIPSPSQFFIVSGSTDEEILSRTEQLTSKLDQLVSEGVISSYQSIARFVPSINTQTIASKAYSSKGRENATKQIAKEFGMGTAWVQSQNQINQPLTVDEIKETPFYERLSYLWFASDSQSIKSTAILLTGVKGSEAIGKLSQLAEADISWIDKPQEISDIFSRYRILFSYVIAIGYLLTFIAIYIKYKRGAWRAVLPPILATCITLAILSSAGETVTLMTVIAFALLLGVGTDYGIFLLQYPGDKRVLLSISIAALMTLISFGSLSLSSVPAIHSFGIALLFGVLLSWLLTLFFAKKVNPGE
jgi:predicted exporter